MINVHLYDYRKERTNLQHSNFIGRMGKKVLGAGAAHYLQSHDPYCSGHSPRTSWVQCFCYSWACSCLIWGSENMFPQNSHTLKQIVHPSIAVTVKKKKIIEQATLRKNYFSNATPVLYFNFSSWGLKVDNRYTVFPNMCKKKNLGKCFK